uniref:Schwannomin interacting protein 1 C-terminal domain-containing protein n=1 Tax=Amblyomma maculatum TaxID=34609 RepID=G3MMP3_AMBMU
MAADTRDSCHEGGPPLLATSQVPVINKLSLAGSTKGARKSEDGSPPETYLWESAEVHIGGSRAAKAKVPKSTSCTSQPSGQCHADWECKTFKELSEMDCGQLHQLCSKLSQLIRERSIDLAPLLEEHHNLQEEIDARNVVIQQLLKLTCQQMELPRRPIQMSVIFPESKTDEDTSDTFLCD